ncbi:MAG: hypothetical protein BWK77_02640 [Verrucomicrobia bacterium A1]|nr:MAG: hypothetical protein BWK77_02640 [Verrucomicrobia bacterium A1]
MQGSVQWDPGRRPRGDGRRRNPKEKTLMTTTRSNGRVGTSRRDFLKQAAMFAAAPAFLPALARGGSGPNSRVTMAILGCGNQAAEDLKSWLPLPNLQIVAVCDVNRASYGYKTPQQFLGREPVRDLINAHYAKGTESGAWKGVDMYTDFREILARKDIDTVAVIVPDHWHTIMTVRAAEAGKDIYCQKPLTLTMAEGPKMIAAVRKHGRILQTGSQWRSNPLMRKFCEMVRNGAVGKIRRIETLVAENNFFGPGPGWKPDPVPEGFDYDAWLGPAPKAPYHRERSRVGLPDPEARLRRARVRRTGMDRGRREGHPERAGRSGLDDDSRRGHPPVREQRPLQGLRRLRRGAQGADRARRGRHPHSDALPPRQHRDEAAPEDQVGSESGAVRRRRRGERDAVPPVPRALGLSAARPQDGGGVTVRRGRPARAGRTMCIPRRPWGRPGGSRIRRPPGHAAR